MLYRENDFEKISVKQFKNLKDSQNETGESLIIGSLQKLNNTVNDLKENGFDLIFEECFTNGKEYLIIF